MASDKPSPWGALKHSTFRWLWLASIASNIGTWMHEVGAGWLMTSLSTNPMHVALVQVAGSAPMFLLALPAGAMADIIDKRRYLLGVQLWMAAVATLLATLTLLGLTTIWLLLSLTLAMGVGTALMMPAWSALTPELVSKRDLPSAIALSSLGINVARALGPAIAGVLVSLSGPWATFALNALSFFAVMAVLLTWKRERQVAAFPAERLLGATPRGPHPVGQAKLQPTHAAFALVHAHGDQQVGQTHIGLPGQPQRGARAVEGLSAEGGFGHVDADRVGAGSAQRLRVFRPGPKGVPKRPGSRRKAQP